ncbi:MAG: efflux RND transporter periplasmic adaptor subunit [Kiritimatiellia bacterium]|nr:efflux RND transporter periplasmic adaptor subunit [Kiritimatiellia bacterium]MDP6847343.1 efflux RND transporter periplasmic adaptor subunit [Kiritimatiellia bacterium]
MESKPPSAVPGHLTSKPPPQRHSRRRWETPLLSILILVGMLTVLFLIFRDRLTVALPVEVATVVLLEQDTSLSPSTVSGERELLFQASGWLEPDPWPVNIAVLTDGFVEDVFIKEGETVTNGQIVARLDAADATLEKRAAEASLGGASARLSEAQDNWQRISSLAKHDVTERERVAARLALDQREAEAKAARVRLETAQLALERTVIQAHHNGVILRRFVEPGQKRRAAMDDPHSATIASLFDPKHLQVRVDVPLAEAGRVFTGQETHISTAMLPGQVFTGRVTRIVGQADIQRNTLQVKVAVRNPSPRLRPEILCRVEFWSDVATPEGVETGRHALWVPEEALPDRTATEQAVWIVDPLTQRAGRRTIRLSDIRTHGHRLVLEGLRANETIILGNPAGLKEGRRIRRMSKP